MPIRFVPDTLKGFVDFSKPNYDYTNLVLNDHLITPKEYLNCKQLKILFKIREGDFYRLRYEEIKEVIYKQLERIYRDDNKINEEEAIHKFN